MTPIDDTERLARMEQAQIDMTRRLDRLEKGQDGMRTSLDALGRKLAYAAGIGGCIVWAFNTFIAK